MDKMATKMMEIANRVGQLEYNIVSALQGWMQGNTSEI